jgi:hypothetical protein
MKDLSAPLLLIPRKERKSSQGVLAPANKHYAHMGRKVQMSDQREQGSQLAGKLRRAKLHPALSVSAKSPPWVRLGRAFEQSCQLFLRIRLRGTNLEFAAPFQPLVIDERIDHGRQPACHHGEYRPGM